MNLVWFWLFFSFFNAFWNCTKQKKRRKSLKGKSLCCPCINWLLHPISLRPYYIKCRPKPITLQLGCKTFLQQMQSLGRSPVKWEPMFVVWVRQCWNFEIVSWKRWWHLKYHTAFKVIRLLPTKPNSYLFKFWLWSLCSHKMRQSKNLTLPEFYTCVSTCSALLSLSS